MHVCSMLTTTTTTALTHARRARATHSRIERTIERTSLNTFETTQHGAVPTLVSLLVSPSLEMVEQAMWVLGKMAQDSQDGTTTARDAVLQAGVLG